MAAPRPAPLFIHPLFHLFMFLFMLGLLVVTAILAYSTVSDIKEMLVPVPVRTK
jgi:hypothetical protein